MLTLETLDKILAHNPAFVSQTVWVAYSGGLDSHVLLHMLAKLREAHPELEIKAVHVNHGLSSDADIWAKHCLKTAEGLSIPCVIKSVDVKANVEKRSVEEVARELRYAAFAEWMGEGDYLLMAHHEDDMAETFLLQAFRGAGPKGLACMPVMRLFAKGSLLRPLLNVSRTDIFDYAKREGLIWVDDPSNASKRFDRNYLRNQLFPDLMSRFPGVKTALSRSAKHCAETHKLLDELAEEDLKHYQGSIEGTLSVSALLTLSFPRQKNLLRYWIRKGGFLLPSQVKLEQLRQDVLQAQPDAFPHLVWDGAEVRRYQDDLYIMSPLPEHYPSDVLAWDMTEMLLLHGVGCLKAYEKVGEGVALPENAALTVRFRQGGERMHPAGRSGSHPLKKLFQEWNIPPWVRDRVPLIYHDDVLVMVVGYALSENYIVRDDRRGKIVLVE